MTVTHAISPNEREIITNAVVDGRDVVLTIGFPSKEKLLTNYDKSTKATEQYLETISVAETSHYNDSKSYVRKLFTIGQTSLGLHLSRGKEYDGMSIVIGKKYLAIKSDDTLFPYGLRLQSRSSKSQSHFFGIQTKTGVTFLSIRKK